MKKYIQGAFIASVIAGATVLTSCGDKAKDTEKVLYWTSIPDKSGTDLSERYKPLTDYLAKELGVTVKYRNSNGYTSTVTSFKNGETHLAWFGGVTGVQARQEVEGARAIAQGAIDPKYQSFFIVHKDSGLKPSETFPKELQNMTFTFGSPSSTSGRVMPTHFIRQATGKLPEDWFTKPIKFTGKRSHTGTANDVANKVVEAGVMSYSTYNKMVKKGDIDPEEVIKLWVTPDYYDYNFTAHPSLNETFGDGFMDKVQAALLKCEDPAVLDCINRKKLISAKNADFDKIAKIMESIDF